MVERPDKRENRGQISDVFDPGKIMKRWAKCPSQRLVPDLRLNHILLTRRRSAVGEIKSLDDKHNSAVKYETSRRPNNFDEIVTKSITLFLTLTLYAN